MLAVGVALASLLSACGGDDVVAPEPFTTDVAETGAPAEPPVAPLTTAAPVTIEVASGAFLGPGSKGDAVRVLQQALTQLDLDPGPVDGQFGPQTEKAVEAFQRSRKLDPDGLVGPKTAQAINEALAELAAGSAG